MQPKIKVLQLGSSTGLYGAERWILSLVKYLDESTIESHVGSISDQNGYEPPICQEARALGLPSHTIQGYGKFSLASIRNLKSVVVEHEIDILHTHGYKTDLLGLLATRGTRCKILSTPHGWTKQPDFKLWLYEALDRVIFPFLDAVVPLSEGILKPLYRIPRLKKKLHFIRNGVDIGEIESLDDIDEEIGTLKRNGAYIIGYIGRLIPGKGLDVLLEAMARHAEPDWHVVFVGEGEQENELRSMASNLGVSDKLHFFGFRPDRLKFLKGFDVFALPSRSEGIPRCLMEAMSAGVPVVASDIPGCRNLIDGSTTGLLFDLDNSQGLAENIKSLKSDTLLSASLKKAAKEFIQAHYSAARMAREYGSLYQDVVSVDD